MSRNTSSRTRSINSTGISSLLVILVVLVSVTLSALCLITVRQDLDRAKKLALSQQEYYAADVKATEKLDILYRLISDETVTDITEVAQQYGIKASPPQRDGKTVFSWSEDIGSDSRLSCKAELSGGTLEITEWKTVSNSYYETESSLPIWDGEGLPI